MVREDARALALKTPAGTVDIGKVDITSRTVGKSSLMPEGLLGALPDHEIVELFSYLKSPRDLPPPDVARLQ